MRLLVVLCAAVLLLPWPAASASAIADPGVVAPLVPSAATAPAAEPVARLVSARAALTTTTYLPTVLTSITRRVRLPILRGAPLPASSTIFGVQLYGDLSATPALLAPARSAHVTWGHWDLPWSSVEPVQADPPVYRFNRIDASIRAAYQAGMHLIVDIGSNPDWAATYPNGPVDKVDMSRFTAFVAALVERYDGDYYLDAPGSPVVDVWEFYNEPDNGSTASAVLGSGYWGHSGVDYARMLCAVYPVVKSTNPRARVAMGGLALDYFDDRNYGDPPQPGPFVRRFLDDVLQAGGGHCIDLMNFHYYPAFGWEWQSYGPGILGKAAYVRSKLQANGVANVPVIITEAGWPSSVPVYSSTPEIQSRWVAQLFTQGLAARQEIVIWWTWVDPTTFNGDFGLLDAYYNRKPAYDAYRTAAEKLAAAAFVRALSRSELGNNPAVQGYQFSAAGTGRPVYVLWADFNQTQAVSLPVSRALLTDLYGRVLGTVADADDGRSDGRIRVTAGANPLYVEAQP